MNRFDNKQERFPLRDHRGHGPRSFEAPWAHRGPVGLHGGGPRGFGFGPGFAFMTSNPPYGAGKKAPRGSVGYAMLNMLLGGPKTGYALIQEFKSRTDDKWTPASGTVYPALGQLLKHEYVEVDGPEEKYSLTDSGRAIAEETRESYDSLFEYMRNDEPDLFTSGKKLFGVLVTLAQTGDSSKQAAMAIKIEELVKEGYRLLGE